MIFQSEIFRVALIESANTGLEEVCEERATKGDLSTLGVFDRSQAFICRSNAKGVFRIICKSVTKER
jgi:hypothetical protein